MRTDAAACPARRGQAQGLRPWEPRQRRCPSTLRKARAALAGASRPLTRRRVFSGGLPPKKTLGGIVKDGGDSRWRKGRSFSTLYRNGLPARRLPTSRKSWEGGRWGSGGRREESPSSEGFPPSSPGTSRLPLSGCPALAPFGDDSPLFLAERQELVGQQRIGEGKVGTLMHTA